MLMRRTHLHACMSKLTFLISLTAVLEFKILPLLVVGTDAMTSAAPVTSCKQRRPSVSQLNGINQGAPVPLRVPKK